jgi:hypothetical protein
VKRSWFASAATAICVITAPSAGAQTVARPTTPVFVPGVSSSAPIITLFYQPASASNQGSRKRSLWLGIAVGAGSGAVAGALWGKYVDKQQVCPASGPCGRRSNAGPYAIVGAAIGAVIGGTIGWFARGR